MLAGPEDGRGPWDMGMTRYTGDTAGPDRQCFGIIKGVILLLGGITESSSLLNLTAVVMLR